MTPANSGDVAFDYGRGVYVPSQPVVDRRLPFTLLGDMDQGMGVRLDMLGGSGLTVWADGVRRTAGTHYLVHLTATP